MWFACTPEPDKQALAQFAVEGHLFEVKDKGAPARVQKYRGICQRLHPYLGDRMLNDINGDLVWSIVQGLLKSGKKIATVNRHLAVLRAILRMTRDEWQWIDNFPKIRLLPGEVERDRWLTREEADRLIAVAVLEGETGKRPQFCAVCHAEFVNSHRIGWPRKVKQ